MEYPILTMVIILIIAVVLWGLYYYEGDGMHKTHGKGDDQGSKGSHVERICALECKQDELITVVNQLVKKGAKMAEEVERLKASNQRLKAAAEAREARDVAQDAVTQENVTLLRERVATLEAQIAGGGLSPEVVAALEETIGDIDAVSTSLEAADPTSPVVEPDPEP